MIVVAQCKGAFRYLLMLFVHTVWLYHGHKHPISPSLLVFSSSLGGLLCAWTIYCPWILLFLRFGCRCLISRRDGSGCSSSKPHLLSLSLSRCVNYVLVSLSLSLFVERCPWAFPPLVLTCSSGPLCLAVPWSRSTSSWIHIFHIYIYMFAIYNIVIQIFHIVISVYTGQNMSVHPVRGIHPLVLFRRFLPFWGEFFCIRIKDLRIEVVVCF